MSIHRKRTVTRCAAGCTRRASHHGLWCDRCWQVIRNDVDFARLELRKCAVLGCAEDIPPGRIFCQDHYGIYAQLIAPLVVNYVST